MLTDRHLSPHLSSTLATPHPSSTSGSSGSVPASFIRVDPCPSVAQNSAFPLTLPPPLPPKSIRPSPSSPLFARPANAAWSSANSTASTASTRSRRQTHPRQTLEGLSLTLATRRPSSTSGSSGSVPASFIRVDPCPSVARILSSKKMQSAFAARNRVHLLHPRLSPPAYQSSSVSGLRPSATIRGSRFRITLLHSNFGC